MSIAKMLRHIPKRYHYYIGYVIGSFERMWSK